MGSCGDEGQRPFDGDAQAAAIVVSLDCPPSVGFDGVADRFIETLSEIALQLAAVTRRQGMNAERKAEFVKLLDDIIQRMEVIDEHVDVLSEHARKILSMMENSEQALFENETRIAAYTVMSLVQRRAQTLHIQRFAFQSMRSIPNLTHANTQVEQFHNARVARGAVVKSVR